MSGDELSLVFSIVFVAPWLLAGWLRIPRYVHYFQEANYDYGRFKLLVSTSSENRYLGWFVFLVVVIAVISCCSSIYLPRVVYEHPVAMVMVNLGVLLFALVFAPHDLLREQHSPLTKRGARLLVSAFLVELIPVMVCTAIISGIYTLITDPRNSGESMILAFGFISLIVSLIISIGPVSFIWTRHAVIVANLINHSLESLSPKR